MLSWVEFCKFLGWDSFVTRGDWGPLIFQKCAGNDGRTNLKWFICQQKDFICLFCEKELSKNGLTTAAQSWQIWRNLKEVCTVLESHEFFPTTASLFFHITKMCDPKKNPFYNHVTRAGDNKTSSAWWFSFWILHHQKNIQHNWPLGMRRHVKWRRRMCGGPCCHQWVTSQEPLVKEHLPCHSQYIDSKLIQIIYRFMYIIIYCMILVEHLVCCLIFFWYHFPQFQPGQVLVPGHLGRGPCRRSMLRKSLWQIGPFKIV